MMQAETSLLIFGQELGNVFYGRFGHSSHMVGAKTTTIEVQNTIL